MLREEKLPSPLCPETGSIWNMSKNNNDDDKKKKITRDQKRGAKDG